jgi:hypothetical protein
MVWINEIPWHEMDVDDELTLLCTNVIAREWELKLRRALYVWRYMCVDTVLNPWLAISKRYVGGNLSVLTNETSLASDPMNRVVSHDYEPLIHSEEDVDRLIRFEEPRYVKSATEEEFEQLEEICRGIIPVRLTGIRHIWFTPWDNLIRLWGVQEAMLDLYLAPDLVSYAVHTYVERALHILDKFEEQHLLSPGAGNVRVGSGGYGYTSDLPEVDSSRSCTTNEMWGCSNAQIFSDVSTEMHWEFALKFDIPWLSRWGMNYYGCCETLHRKAEILHRIPNLRKISMSPWAKLEEAAEAFGNDYVFSIKPNPAIFVDSGWDVAVIEKDLKRLLLPVVERKIGCEIIMKDISTVEYQPERLWQWASTASKVVEECARYY